MDRVERLTNLLLVLLDARGPLTMHQIVDAVDGYPSSVAACRQAFERDKRTLREEGIPLETVTSEEDDQVVPAYTIRAEDYYLPDLGLTSDEQAALNLAVAAVQLDEGSGRDARWKLGGLERDSPPPLAALPSLPGLARLHQAMRARAPVRFAYRGRSRSVDPYGLGFRGGFWYLVGWDHDRDERRTFRVDRMEGDVEVGDADTFEPPEDFELSSALPDDPWAIGEGEAVTAKVLVDHVHAAQVTAELGTEAVTDRRDDGSIVVRMAVTNPAAFRSWVIGLLDHAVVLGPASLRGEVVGWLESVAAVGAR